MSKTKMTNAEIVDLNNAIVNLKKSGIVVKTKLLYSANMTRRKIIDHAEGLEETRNEKLKPFNKEKDEIAKKYSIKKDGKPVMLEDGKGYSIKQNDVSEVMEQINLLEEKYKDVFDELKELGRTEVEVDIFFCDKENFPEELHANLIDLTYLISE